MTVRAWWQVTRESARKATDAYFAPLGIVARAVRWDDAPEGDGPMVDTAFERAGGEAPDRAILKRRLEELYARREGLKWRAGMLDLITPPAVMEMLLLFAAAHLGMDRGKVEGGQR